MTDQESRKWLRQLFGEKPETPETDPPDLPRGNYVPSEGNNPEPPKADADMREFARQLFDRD